MSKTKFTPGPWRVSESGFLAQSFIIGKDNTWENSYRLGSLDIWGDRDKIADLTYTDKADCNGAANAALIVAAPDLYHALNNLIEKLVIDDEEGLIEYAEPLITARAALAKARGEATQ